MFKSTLVSTAAAMLLLTATSATEQNVFDFLNFESETLPQISKFIIYSAN